jgi:hypothetical protein
VGQKVLSKPSADSFAVGRRQKPDLSDNLGQITVIIITVSVLSFDKAMSLSSFHSNQSAICRMSPLDLMVVPARIFKLNRKQNVTESSVTLVVLMLESNFK